MKTLTAKQYAAKHRADRQAWRDQMPQRCMGCGRKESWCFGCLQIHEIERKSHAQARWAQRCNYLLLCIPCHSGKFAAMPHAAQLAVKKLHDPKHYKLKAWHAIGGRPLSYVTQAEVSKWQRKLDVVLGRN